ncbi:MAG: 1,6-anhydro-N-acetylmuramyl-L-alanine amidase AmpD [Burkholderiales bacterium]|nr:1,6-anhydro-N-acetylmuramyl-L-alanine amidase AmpD [Burkholderiales bacterium]
MIDAEGLLEGAIFISSPNCDDRPQGATIDLVVIHNISLPPGEFGGEGVTQLFTNTLDPDEHAFYATIAGLRVSSHFYIRRNGEIIQYVPVDKRAWHAGVSQWRGREKCNDFSVGIELEGTDEMPYTENQYAALEVVTFAMLEKYPGLEYAGHCDISPGRKTDPGSSFDRERYAGIFSRSP